LRVSTYIQSGMARGAQIEADWRPMVDRGQSRRL